MDITERMQLIVNELHGGNKARFAKTIGLAPTSISNYLSKSRASKPSSDILENIIKNTPSINANWLLTGEGSMLQEDKSSVKYVAPYIGEDLIEVKYVSAKAYASFIESMYSVEYDLETYGVRPEDGEDLSNGKFMVFDIDGDSMHPTIQSGSKILCEKIEKGSWEYAKGVIVIVYGKTLTVKRILKNNLYMNNTLTIKADNPTYGEIDIEKCEIRGMWQAVRVVSMKIL